MELTKTVEEHPITGDQAEPVALYALGGPEFTGHPRRGETIIRSEVAEDDSAVAGWPIIVKVREDVSQAALAQHLRDLAADVEAGHFQDFTTAKYREHRRLIDSAKAGVRRVDNLAEIR